MPSRKNTIRPALPVDYAETATIHESTVGKGLRSVMVTSAIPGEGTSTIAYALSQHAAITGKRVLLVDLNTHNSFATETLCLNAKHWDLGEPVDPDAVFRIPGRSLSILPPPPQGAFLVSRRTIEAAQRSLQTWTNEYDVVVVDAPCLTRPNSSGLPTAVLATCVDSVCLVVASGETTKDAISQAMARLGEQNLAPHSIVLNDRVTPSLRAEIDRQFRKWGKIGAILKRFLWTPFAGLPIFDEGY